MSVEVIQSYEQFETLSDEWNRLLRSSRNNIVCLTHEWFASWWRAYGEGKRLFILLVRNHNGELTGIAPLLRTRELHRGLVPVSMIRFIENGLSPHLDIISALDEEETVIKEMVNYLVNNKTSWDMLDFNKLQDSCIFSRLFVDLCQQNAWCYRVYESLVSPFISIDTDWESFYGSRSRKFRKGMKNKINRVSRHGGIEVERVNTMPYLRDRLPDLYKVSSRSWKARNGSAITSNPEDMTFYNELTYSAGQNGWVQLWFLKHENVPIACEYHLVYGSRAMILRGDSDVSYRSISPGSFLEYNIIKTCFQESEIKEYDFCGDNYKYMRNWTDKAYAYKRVQIFNSRLVPKLIGFAECKLLPYIKKLKPEKLIRS